MSSSQNILYTARDIAYSAQRALSLLREIGSDADTRDIESYLTDIRNYSDDVVSFLEDLVNWE